MFYRSNHAKIAQNKEILTREKKYSQHVFLSESIKKFSKTSFLIFFAVYS